MKLVTKQLPRIAVSAVASALLALPLEADGSADGRSTAKQDQLLAAVTYLAKNQDRLAEADTRQQEVASRPIDRSDNHPQTRRNA